jgi:hypothetical protein
MALRTLSTQDIIDQVGCHYDVLMNQQRLYSPESDWHERLVESLSEAQEMKLADLETAVAELEQDSKYQKFKKVEQRLKRFLEGSAPVAWVAGLRFTWNRKRAQNVYLPNIRRYLDRVEVQISHYKKKLESGFKMIPLGLEATVPEVGDSIWEARTTSSKLSLTEKTVTDVQFAYYHHLDDGKIHVIVTLDDNQTISWRGQLDSNEIREEQRTVSVRRFFTREAAQEHLEHYLNKLESQISELREEINS